MIRGMIYTNVMNISVVKHIKCIIHSWLCRDMSVVAHGDLVFVVGAWSMDRAVWCANTSDLCEPLCIACVKDLCPVASSVRAQHYCFLLITIHARHF